jgi:hypothetical protein
VPVVPTGTKPKFTDDTETVVCATATAVENRLNNAISGNTKALFDLNTRLFSRMNIGQPSLQSVRAAKSDNTFAAQNFLTSPTRAKALRMHRGATIRRGRRNRQRCRSLPCKRPSISEKGRTGGAESDSMHRENRKASKFSLTPKSPRYFRRFIMQRVNR